MSQEHHFTQEDAGGEEIQWRGKPSKKSQIVPIIVGILLIPIGIGLISLLSIYIRVYYTTYVVTDEALYKKKGILSDKIKRVPLSKIQNTEYRTSFVEKQFGFGSVQISSAGSSGTELNFRSVEDPERVQNLINQLSSNSSENSPTGASGIGKDKILEEVRKTRQNIEEIADYLDREE